ncbi:MAG: hypothetical protein WBX01_00750 [Nitrososphaeraceae archaeon]|jgi:hypothetical protein
MLKNSLSFIFFLPAAQASTSSTQPPDIEDEDLGLYMVDGLGTRCNKKTGRSIISLLTEQYQEEGGRRNTVISNMESVIAVAFSGYVFYNTHALNVPK